MNIRGLRIASARSGIRGNYSSRNDLALMELSPESTVAACFTQNKFAAAPVLIAKKHLTEINQSPLVKLLIINSGNANAAVSNGWTDCFSYMSVLAQKYHVPASQILPFSTGVIGVPLPVENIIGKIDDLVDSLSDQGWEEAAETIMTTDTERKVVNHSFHHQGSKVNLVGIAKGSGMIMPNMATMLAYIATDIAVDSDLLQSILNHSVESSFNRISVDGDTSTNDAVVLIATGGAELLVLNTKEDDLFAPFQQACDEVCQELAKSIVLDGEGATKLVEIEIKEAVNLEQAKNCAKAIANSPLVKTAFHAEDANWGRIIAALGNAEANFQPQRVMVQIDGHPTVYGGTLAQDYDEQAVTKSLQKREFKVSVGLGAGDASCVFYTCDLSKDYIDINANYRS